MIGTVINNYRIVGVLDHSGGMGVVYRAEHVTMGQKAVIKQLLPQFNQHPQLVARFLNEARAAAAIDDPGIVKVFDQGTLADGSAYLTMELLSGESLRSRIQREPLSPALAVSLMRQAARAVGAAHRHGIIHRDLKPENLFLCRDPELPDALRVKVLDFGIAKLSDGASGVQTQTGMPLGTPAYMAPEQWRGADRVDARADIYALGCVLYELLAGHPPFPGPELPAFMDQHRFRAPPALAGISPALAGFDGVVQRALAKSPEDRFATMEELIAALPSRPGATPAPAWPTAASWPVEPGLPATTPNQLDLGAPPVGSRRGSRVWSALVLIGVAGAGAASAVVVLRGSPPDLPPVVAGSGGVAGDPAARLPAGAPPAAPAPVTAAPARDAAAIAPESRCPAAQPAALTRTVPPPLGRPAIQRSADLIVDFSLARIAPHPDQIGSGGIGAEDPAFDALRGCSDSPDGTLAVPGAAIDHAGAGLHVEITAVDPAGPSGRGWTGARCSYRLTDPRHPELHASLGPADVPAFNALTGLVRDGSAVYVTLQFNGYAKETHRKGNLVAMLDLCEHRVVWRSADLTSNAAIAIHGDALITGYGFTAEAASLIALDRWTGAKIQRLALPKSPSELRIQDGTLYVRLYDGYAAVPLR